MTLKYYENIFFYESVITENSKIKCIHFTPYNILTTIVIELLLILLIINQNFITFYTVLPEIRIYLFKIIQTFCSNVFNNK